MYYVRCATRSSGASSKGTPEQALRYITDAHDAERDPTYSHEELRYIARLDPGWKTDLEGGRLPLVGLGQLYGIDDQAALSRGFQRACQPWHDNRGVTGYLSYTFTMPKELSLLAEGHPVRARQAMYAALQTTLTAAFPNKSLKAVATVHARNEAGEVHYHAHVLIGKFARDILRRRVYSLNSRSGGNTGKERVAELKRAWKHSLDAELHRRLGVAVTQPAPFAAPTVTPRGGQPVEPLTRQSRRILDKFLCQQLSRSGNADGATKPAFRWTKMDATIYELAASPKAGGWDARAFCELFPELAKRLKTYEARVATLKRISYLDDSGKITDAFTLHYSVHTGDRPELRRLLADLHAAAKRGRDGGDGGMGGDPSPAPATAVTSPPSAGNAGTHDPDVDLWLAFHRRQQFAQRLDRLDLSADVVRDRLAAARRLQPTPAVLARFRQEARDRPPAPRAAQPRPGIVRAYVELQGARVVTTFILAKGMMTLTPLESAALARKMLEHARRNYFLAKEGMLATAARRMRPLNFIGRLTMPADFERLDLALRRMSSLPSTSQWAPLFQRQMQRAYRNSRESLQAQIRAEQATAGRAKQGEGAPAPGREDELLAKAARAPAVAIPATMAALAEDIRRANARAYAVGVHPPFTAEVLMALPAISIGRAINQLRVAGVLLDGRSWAAREATRSTIAAPLQELSTALLAQARDLER